MDETKLDRLAKVLTKQIDQESFDKKYAPIKKVLIMVGAGAFLAASITMPNLPLILKPYLDKEKSEEYEVWKRFNVRYLKRSIQRLERQKLVEINEENDMQVIKITNNGRQKILKFALDELTINKPKVWDQKWRLVSFDLPEKLAVKRKILVEYLRVWGFYPLHKSVYLHAYPCFKEIDFLRGYLGIAEYVRLFTAAEIENDKLFKDFFGV